MRIRMIEGTDTGTKLLYPEFDDSSVCYPVVLDGKIYIGNGILKTGLKAGGAPSMLVDKANYSLSKLTAECNADPIGEARLDVWSTPSRSFENPGEGGYTATIHMGTKGDCETSARLFLQCTAEAMLDSMAGGNESAFTAWGEYTENDIPEIVKEALAFPGISNRLDDMNLESEDLAALLRAPFAPDAIGHVADELYALDGMEEKE